MSDDLVRNRALCLDQAQGFIEAARRVGASDFPHIVYHLSLLALEETGKASLIAGKLATGGMIDSPWVDKAMESHRRKLQWAIWSPIDRIDPADFVAAREFAESAHAMRLASLYIDAGADAADVPASEIVRQEDADRALALAEARLEYERVQGTPDPNGHANNDQLRWFLETMADPERSRQLLSRRFLDKYHDLGNDASVWVAWARKETIRLEEEAKALLASELARPAPAVSKPRWRANATIHTPSHSIRPKALQRWNSQIEAVQLLPCGKKDRLTLQLTINDNAPLSELGGRAASLAKLVVACLNIGTIGYFWFERPGLERQMFDEVRDLEHRRRLQIEPKESFWGDERAVALTDEHIDHAIRCMMAFATLPEQEAEPIFRPYLDGLALIAKSDAFYSFDLMARHAFVACLSGALARYGGWNGDQGSLRVCFDAAFAPIMPDPEHREQMFRVLTPEGDAMETPLANLRSAKQLADLYLILVGRRNWSTILRSPGDAM